MSAGTDSRGVRGTVEERIDEFIDDKRQVIGEGIIGGEIGESLLTEMNIDTLWFERALAAAPKRAGSGAP